MYCSDVGRLPRGYRSGVLQNHRAGVDCRQYGNGVLLAILNKGLRIRPSHT
jgi:hypothetical protein